MQAVDPDLFLNIFGQDATIGPAADPIRCIFDDLFELVNQFTGAIEMSAPAAQVRTSDLVGFLSIHGVAFATGGVDYVINGNQPDGSGFTRLILKEI